MKNLEFETVVIEEINNEIKTDYLHTSNCRRYQLDRRVTNIKLITRLFNRGERSEHRRKIDQQNFTYFDRHEPHLLLISVFVILCSIVDAFLTLKIIGTGGVELNYFADILLGFGLYGFIFSKYLITAFGMIVLVLHKQYQVFMGLQVRHLIYSIVFIYALLILYEAIIILVH